MTAPAADDVRGQLAEALTEPVQGRCGTCGWPTNTLPCSYCAAERRARATRLAPPTEPKEQQA